MDYEAMTVPELRELAKKWGANVPKGMKKADIIGLLYANEPVEVEAEVMEQDTMAITFNAGEITANFDALEAKVDSILAIYDGWEPTSDNEDDIEQCARERKYLNGLAKQLDERRKDVKNQYLAPLSAFESKANAIRDKIKAVSDRLKSVEKEADDFRRADKKAILREHYEAYAGLLADVIPYEKIHEEQWLNKTYQLSKAQHQIEAMVKVIADDWEAVKRLEPSVRADAEPVFFDTLDFGKALAWALKVAEDRKRIDEMESQMGPRESDLPTEGKKKVISDIAAMLDWYDCNKLANLRNALERSRTDTGEARPVVMLIDKATQGQLDVVGKFCGLAGITGVFKLGTLEEVAGRGRYAG